MTDEKKPIEFIKRYHDGLFTRWKGGRYAFNIHDNEIELFYWIFENNLQDEIRYKLTDNYTRKPYDIFFKTPEAFMAFKLYWL